MKKIAIVIPTYNRKEALLRLLDCLKIQVNTFQNMEFRIIVVVDGSTDGTLEAIRTFSFPVEIIQGDGSWWWSRSVNEGCRKALGNNVTGILLLNDDTRPASDYLIQLAEAIETKPGAIIGSLNITDEATPKFFFSGVPRMQWVNGKPERYHPFLSPYQEEISGMHESIILTGRGMYIPSEVFEGNRLFDEKKFPQYKADYDFVLRAVKRHVPCYISWDMKVYVNAGSTGKGATFTRQGVASFLSSCFNKYSRTGFSRNLVYYWRHYPRKVFFLFPITAVIVFARQICLFYKSLKYPKVS